MGEPLVLFETICSRFAMSSSFLPMSLAFWNTLSSRALISSVLLSRTVLKLATFSDRLPIFASFSPMSSLLLATLVFRMIISSLLSSMLSLIRVFFYAVKKIGSFDHQQFKANASKSKACTSNWSWLHNQIARNNILFDSILLFFFTCHLKPTALVLLQDKMVEKLLKTNSECIAKLLLLFNMIWKTCLL